MEKVVFPFFLFSVLPGFSMIFAPYGLLAVFH
jgi:hypothetical protein